MRDFVSRFSSSTKSIVNDELINCRRNENMVEYIDDLCKEIQKMIGPDVEYLGYQVNDKITQVREMNKGKPKSKKSFSGIILSTEPTYARSYNFNFKLTFKGEVSNVSMNIYVPLISEDGVNYLIKGNKYCSPFQLVDAVTYNRVDPKNKYEEVCLKTSIRDIKMQRYKSVIRDIDGVPYSCARYNLSYNSKVNKVPFLLFYFATFGFYRTLDYFGLSTPLVGVKLYADLPELDDPLRKNHLFFKFGAIYLGVLKFPFLSSTHVRDLICTILATKKRITQETVCKTDYWIMALGSVLSQNNTLSSGYSLRTSFSNDVDPRTVEIIETFIGKKNLNSTYSVVRWMFNTFSINVSKDSSLINKRLRLSEYIIDPLKQVLKRKAYQYSGSRGGYRDIRRLEDVFKISSSILLDAINGKSKISSTGKFSNVVNDFSIMNSITKCTQVGANMGSKGAHLPKEFKRLHQSMLSRVDIIATSVNNPGSSLSLLPNCKIDSTSLGFKKVLDD